MAIERRRYDSEGKCVARVNDMVVFVPWAVPGDVVDFFGLVFFVSAKP